MDFEEVKENLCSAAATKGISGEGVRVNATLAMLGMPACSVRPPYDHKLNEKQEGLMKEILLGADLRKNRLFLNKRRNHPSK